MNWDDLKIFLAVARSGSISGAGRKLGVRHSTVSRRLRGLEERLGLRLVERVRGGYALTPAGEDLKGSAARMETEVLTVDRGLLGHDTSLRGPLRVAVVNHIATSLLMPMFASFSRKYPEVSLEVMGSNVYVSLPQREADVAIRVTNSPPETLLGKRVARFSSAIYGSRGYVLHLRESGDEPDWLGTECCDFHRSWTAKRCPDGKHRFTIDETALASAALKENLGLTFLPCFLGDSDPDLVRYCEPEPIWDLDLWILIHSDLRRTARVRVFREHMQQQLAEQRDLIEARVGS